MCEKLAINGEKKAAPKLPSRLHFGKEEKAAVDALFNNAIKTGNVPGYNGPEEEAFCKEFAKFMGAKYADGTNGGTNSVYVALVALNLPPFSEVIVGCVTDPGGMMPIVINNCIHTVDLLLYFNGDVSEVTGRIARLMHKSIEVEDTVVAMLKFKNNSLGTIEASTACAPGFPRRVELSGTKGSVILEDDRITRWSFTDERPEDGEIRRIGGLGEGQIGGSSDPNAIFPEGHRRQISELAEAILNGQGLTTPGAEGKRAVELICAVYESARTGTTIKFL